ncbi:uncharacterized protein LOC132912753 [Bombus pascuorum]|uniref:uncharacterized protein LOC132912753 n=1 Tax=Bombus pascuorum TaxID=65598 RepID=UPI00298DFA87|nr:uncharacterized protein LOC132912753 [Bombus pascuorum]
MADDPNRDILPVREGSCVDSCRSSIDPRERHIVFKLDRYQLEDRYLRLLDEVNNLKKLTNCQEDKIKRLTTKLMRVTGNSRSCTIALDVYEDKNKIISLELENSKLKDKVSVLRNQLLSHTITGRSSSRSRNPQARPSSGRTTCRSESSRAKISSCHCIDDNARCNLNKIEELEAQKKEMSNRITELEEELSTYTAMNQREKVAENVEYIRVWRQMKQLNDKLIATENENESLNAQINDLKRELYEKTKNNETITTELLTEKKRVAEIDEQMLKAKDSQLSLREKDEHIKDLVNEMKILQQHNSELIDLSSKYGEVELENKELKKKVTEQLHDQETLKTAFNTEQANIGALKTSNEQLLGKLEELQKNIDSLTVQLTCFQTQTEKQETTKTTPIPTKQPETKIPMIIDKCESHKDASIQVEKCNILRNVQMEYCEALEKIFELDIARKEQKCKACCELSSHVDTTNAIQKSIKLMDRSVQTEHESGVSTVDTKDLEIITPIKETSKMEEPQIATQSMDPAIVTKNYLTPDKMLKLLEQAQISTPTDAAKFNQKHIATDADYSDMMDQNQRHRQVVSLEKLLFGDSNLNKTRNKVMPSGIETLVQGIQEAAAFQVGLQQQKKDNASQSTDPNTVLSVLFNILQEYIYMIPHEANTLYRAIPPVKYQFVKDINNNDTTLNSVAKSSIRSGCSTRKYCTNPYSKQKKPKRKLLSNVQSYSRPVKVSDDNDCTCSSLLRCNLDTQCDRCCCNSTKPLTCNFNNTQMQCKGQAIKSKNDLIDSKTSFHNDSLAPTRNGYIPRTSGALNISRQLQDDKSGPYKSPETRETVQNRNNSSASNKSLQEYIKYLDRCKKTVSGIPVNEIVKHVQNIDSIRYHPIHRGPKSEVQKVDSFCSADCPNDCVDVTSAFSDSFPLVIADGQGLVELHIVSLQLSTSAKQILFREKNISNVLLFVSWNIWNQDTTYTPTLKCPKLNFNSSFVYRISDLFSFFNYILLELVTFQVNVFHDNDNYMVAKGKLCIKDILDYPQNKLHYIIPVNSILPCSVGMNFGQLSLWVRLSCDIEQVEAFKRRYGIISEPPLKTLIPEKPPETLIPEKPPETLIPEKPPKSKEIVPPKDDPLVLKDEDSKIEDRDPGKLPDVSTSIIEPPYIDESRKNHRERDCREVLHFLNKKLDRFKDVILNRPQPMKTTEKSNEESEMGRPSLVEFNAFLSNGKTDEPGRAKSVDSISEVTNVIADKNWQQYKERTTFTFKGMYNNLYSPTEDLSSEYIVDDKDNDLQLGKDSIIIEIMNLILFPKSTVMQNPEYQLLYIEYCFLGYCGADMETVSVKKPLPPNQKLTYNFKRKFRVHEEKYPLQNRILCAMLDQSINSNIKFIVVCEPLPEETDTKECVEVGFANFNIRDYALGSGEPIMSIPVYTPDTTEQIGLLKIYVLGFDTIRQYLGRRESIL